MVNEAYLNRLNGAFTRRDQRMTKWRQVDRLDPFGLRIDHQCADARARCRRGCRLSLACSLSSQAWPRERVGQRPLPELEQQQRQGAAEQRGVDAGSSADGQSRTRARPRRPPWRRRRRPSPWQSRQKPPRARSRLRRHVTGVVEVPCRSERRGPGNPPPAPATPGSEIVMVKRSLAAANAIRAGNSRSRAMSRIMGLRSSCC